jgi:hypothetical protein
MRWTLMLQHLRAQEGSRDTREPVRKVVLNGKLTSREKIVRVNNSQIEDNLPE